jgi:membrane protease YdiL (CAAX protease family)
MNMEPGFDHSAAAPSPAPLVEPPAEPAADKPRIWTVFVTWFVAALVGQIAVIAMFVFAGATVGLVLGAQGVERGAITQRVTTALTQPIPALLLSVVPFQLTLILIVVLAARRSKTPLRDRLGLLPAKGREFGGLTLAGLAAGTLSLALAIAIGMSLLIGFSGGNQAGATVSDGSWLGLTLLAVVLSLLPAVVEEIFFRGYIQRRLLQRWSPAAAIAVSTALFAVLHADSLQHILSVIPLGVVTGWLAYRTNSVKPGMVVHAIHNAGAMAFAGVAKVLIPGLGDETAGWVILTLVAALAVASLPALLALWQRDSVAGAIPTPTLSQSALAA